MLVYFTISLAVLLGCCGMAIDVGRMELRTAQLQAAADDAAVTVAAEIQRGNYATVSTLLTSEVSAFLTQAGLPSATASYQFTSSMAPYTTDYDALQTTITQTIPLYFLALVGKTSAPLTVRAVALLPACVFFRDNALNPPAQNVRLASAGFRAGCPVYAARNVINDYFSYGGSGQWKITGTLAQSSGSSGPYTVPAIYNSPVLADPLAYITAPLSPTSLTCNHTVAVTLLVPTTISPGNYCGGLVITATNVTMLPGLYVISGPVLITAGSVVTGSGVTLYLTNGAGFGFGPFSLVASTWKVNAPTDASAGGIPGIVLFGDRNWVGGQFDFIFNNSAVYQADGIIYTTNTGLSVQSSNMNSNGNYFGIDVASLYEYASNINPACSYAPLPGGNPFHSPVGLVQ